MSFSGPAVAGAVCTGLLVGVLSWRIVRPRRTLGRRMALYTELSRSRLGGEVSTTDAAFLLGEATRRVLGPLARGIVSDVARLLGVADAEALELRLRRAGYPMSTDSYRRRHLRWSIATPLVLGAAGAMMGSALLVLGFFAGGVFIGLRRLPDQVKTATTRRSARIRSDLPTVAAMLSPKIENRKSLLTAVAEVVAQGSGPVVDDLARGLNLISAGYGDAATFNRLAAEAAEETAARFYRFLAAATQGGIDLPRALLEHAEMMRVQRREEVERSAARRQMSMVIPDLVFMAPVLLLFLLAPVPRLLFGAG